MTLRYPATPDVGHILVAVDPGKHYCGVALGWAGSGDNARIGMYVAGKVPSHKVRDWADANYEHQDTLFWVAETPQKYKTRRSTHRDLDALEAVLASLPPLVARWTPMEWKRNTPKAAHHARVWEALTGFDEQRRMWGHWHGPDESHDVRDAIALWLFAVGRLGPGGPDPVLSK